MSTKRASLRAGEEDVEVTQTTTRCSSSVRKWMTFCSPESRERRSRPTVDWPREHSLICRSIPTATAGPVQLSLSDRIRHVSQGRVRVVAGGSANVIDVVVVCSCFHLLLGLGFFSSSFFSLLIVSPSLNCIQYWNKEASVMCYTPASECLK